MNRSCRERRPQLTPGTELTPKKAQGFANDYRAMTNRTSPVCATRYPSVVLTLSLQKRMLPTVVQRTTLEEQCPSPRKNGVHDVFLCVSQSASRENKQPARRTLNFAMSAPAASVFIWI